MDMFKKISYDTRIQVAIIIVVLGSIALFYFDRNFFVTATRSLTRWTQTISITPTPNVTQTVIMPGNNAFSNKEVFYTSTDLKIQGFLYKPYGTHLPAILYLHGGTTGFQTQNYVEQLKKRGYVVLAINYPGEGKSQGTYQDPLQENQAAIDAIPYIKSLSFVNQNKIGIMGSSHGAGINLMVLERINVQVAADAFGATDARKICEYWAFTGFKGTTQSDCDNQSQDYFDARSSIENIQKINTPLIVVHGGKDTVVPVGQSRALVSKLSELNKVYKYKEYPNATHGFIYQGTPDATDANKLMFEWFDAYLK